MRIHISAFLVLIVFAAGCGEHPCADLQKAVCKAAPDTQACRKASRLTNDDECHGYLKDVDKYVKLTNLVADKPGVRPPAPEPSSPAAPAAEAAAPEPPVAEPAPAAATGEGASAVGPGNEQDGKGRESGEGGAGLE